MATVGASIGARLLQANGEGVKLDEPSTNLDTANAEAFASALHEVIEHRKQQKNFQLVVITHDEKFVKSLGASGYCNHYYRVSKQTTGGEIHSAIEQVAISQFD